MNEHTSSMIKRSIFFICLTIIILGCVYLNKTNQDSDYKVCMDNCYVGGWGDEAKMNNFKECNNICKDLSDVR